MSLADTGNLLITGEYPSLIFLPFVLVGLVAVRSDLGRPRTQAWLMVSGTVVSVLGYGAAVVIPGVGSTAQILVLAFVIALQDYRWSPDCPGWPIMIGMTLATIGFASLWRRIPGKGPLERALAFATRKPVTRVRARAHVLVPARPPAVEPEA